MKGTFDMEQQFTSQEFQTVLQACQSLAPPQGDYHERDYVLTLMNTVLDYQMTRPILAKATAYFQEHHAPKIKTHEDLEVFLDQFPDNREGNRNAAWALWGYNYWNRLEQLRKLQAYFKSVGVTDLVSLRAWAQTSNFKTDFRGKISGLAEAIYQWLIMRVGVDTIKPDLHVLRFLQKVAGRSFSQAAAVAMLQAVAKELGRPAHLLDWAIWESGRSQF
jgi:hypothetical protein